MSRALGLERLESRVLLATVTVGVGRTLLQAGDIGQTADGVQLAQVIGGQAMVEVTDLNANGRVDRDEVTAVYAGNNLNLKTWVGINGPIVTNLEANGTLSGVGDAGDVLLNSKIVGLNIGGDINGDIMAGAGVSNVKAAVLDGYVGVGTEASGWGVDYDGDTVDEFVLAAFVPTAGAAGGSISNFTLGWVDSDGFYAGNGGDSATGAGGAGGSITNIIATGGEDLYLYAGDGGGGVSLGGAGGKVSTVKATNITGWLEIYGGYGGDASAGAGGASGSITNILETGFGFYAFAGYGGDGATRGGAGGSVSAVTLDLSGDGSSDIYAGYGGDASVGAGGAGGSVCGGIVNSYNGIDVYAGYG